MSEGKVSFLGAPPSRPWLQAPVRPSPPIPLRFHLPCKPLSHHPDPLFQWMTSPPTDKMKMTGCKFHHFKMYHHLNSALTVLLVLEEEVSWLPPRPIHSLHPINPTSSQASCSLSCAPLLCQHLSLSWPLFH